jgi:flagellar biosynthesis/type III secretory pathway M-ring protein FliF/YscJ
MKRKWSSMHWGIVGVCFVVVAIVAVIAVVALMQRPGKEINSFQACKDAGGAIAESYPEQCFINGKSFTNDEQSLDNNGDEYIGLAEQEALDKASRENKIARVVERDGESLPVTMDFMPGRLNLSVQDGKVNNVQVEGEEN